MSATALAAAGAVRAQASSPAAGWGAAVYAGARAGSGFESSGGGNAGSSLALRSSGAVALALEAPFDDHRRLQLYLARQQTRLALGTAAAAGTPAELPLVVSTLHIGGTNYFDGPAGQGPYVVGGLGLTHLSPNLPGTSARTRWSMHVGLGHEWPLARALSMRVELRGHAALLRSEGGFFCSGGCTVFVRGDTLTQVEALVGVRVGF